VYAAPESLVEGEDQSVLMDIFSFGVLSLEICTGCFPRPGVEYEAVGGGLARKRTQLERRAEHLGLMEDANPLKPIVVQCLAEDPEARPSAAELVRELTAPGAAAQIQEAQDDLAEVQAAAVEAGQAAQAALAQARAEAAQAAQVAQATEARLEAQLVQLARTANERAVEARQAAENAEQRNRLLQKQIGGGGFEGARLRGGTRSGGSSKRRPHRRAWEAKV
jgi:hypothetical protein